MNITKALIKRFEHGDHLTDAELGELLLFFMRMRDGCYLLGPKYGLFYDKMNRDIDRIEAYQFARNPKIIR